MENNLSLYKKIQTPPQEALRSINAGRLKGKTDINPMWRIKTLTEQFGVCGIGWRYDIERMWLEPGSHDQVAAFVKVNLFIKVEEKWSEPIPGIGGSMLVAKENSGLHTSDECYKMALTDALSVACKALGMAATVYWDKDPSKYTKPGETENQTLCEDCELPISGLKLKSGNSLTTEQVAEKTEKQYGVKLCLNCANARKQMEDKASE